MAIEKPIKTQYKGCHAKGFVSEIKNNETIDATNAIESQFLFFLFH